MYNLLMVRYGELGLKGKNRATFINKLVENIKYALIGTSPREITSTWGRIWVPGSCDMPEAMDRLSRVFGIYSISPVIKVEKDMNAIKEAALRVLKDSLPKGGSFKVESRRADKKFHLKSPEISIEVANYLFSQIDDSYQADMYNPEKEITIEVRPEGAYVYGEVFPGAKGLPVGSSAKALLMLSGGIDSPVAGHMALKRGVNLEAIHYHSYPFTTDRAKEKVIDLCHVLARYHNKKIPLHVVHFTEIQKAIKEKCPAEYGITIMRRMMFRIAEKIAKRQKAWGIYTGESLGQVASQTLESIFTINQVTQIPILRPLIGFDKEEIVERAQNIGSYDISIQPYEDCCTLFLPSNPKIKPDAKVTAKLEQALDIDGLIDEAIAKTETLKVAHYAEY